MKEERARLNRLRRLERIRDIAKQTAAAESAAAESTLSQLRALSDRTRQLASDYGQRRQIANGEGLHQVSRFVGGLNALTRSTEGDAARAQSIADAKLQLLAEAERRRAAIEERAENQAKVIAKGSQTPILGSRKAIGTDLD